MITHVYPNFRTRKTKVGFTMRPGGGCTQRALPDGEIAGDILISIDIDAIVQTMGRKALLNKTGKCKDGFVSVTVRNKRDIP